MTYTLSRFPIREDRPVLEAIKNVTQTSVFATSLGRILEKRVEKKSSEREAKRAMLQMMKYASRAQESGPEGEDVDLFGRVLKKVLKFVGKRIIKAIVRPILRFAGRMAMSIIRIAARTLLRF